MIITLAKFQGDAIYCEIFFSNHFFLA